MSKRRLLFSVDVDWIPGSDGGLRRLMDFCLERNVPAMLFITGRFAEAYPDLIRDAAENGFEIGTHGWEHGQDDGEDFRSGSADQQRRWIDLSTEAVANAAGVTPRAFRAPNLAVSETTLRILEDRGYEIDSSVPARRFDFFYGQVNHPRYFGASLEPYHPDPASLGRSGQSRVLEIPPSAFFLPMNMSSLRVLGLSTVSWAVSRISRRSRVLVFYVHPVEFELPEKQTIPGSNPRRYLRGLGPENLGLVERLLDICERHGYAPGTFADVAATFPTSIASGDKS